MFTIEEDSHAILTIKDDDDYRSVRDMLLLWQKLAMNSEYTSISSRERRGAGNWYIEEITKTGRRIMQDMTEKLQITTTFKYDNIIIPPDSVSNVLD